MFYFPVSFYHDNLHNPYSKGSTSAVTHRACIELNTDIIEYLFLFLLEQIFFEQHLYYNIRVFFPTIRLNVYSTGALSKSILFFFLFEKMTTHENITPTVHCAKQTTILYTLSIEYYYYICKLIYCILYVSF